MLHFAIQHHLDLTKLERTSFYPTQDLVVTILETTKKANPTTTDLTITTKVLDKNCSDLGHLDLLNLAR